MRESKDRALGGEQEGDSKTSRRINYSSKEYLHACVHVCVYSSLQGSLGPGIHMCIKNCIYTYIHIHVILYIKIHMQNSHTHLYLNTYIFYP